MSGSFDADVLLAAQALSMLATGQRQQQHLNTSNTAQEGDDCVITGSRPVARDSSATNATAHSRPVVNRYHPYRRPGPQPVPARPFSERPRVLHEPNRLKEEWRARAKLLLQEASSIFPAEDRERANFSQSPVDPDRASAYLSPSAYIVQPTPTPAPRAPTPVPSPPPSEQAPPAEADGNPAAYTGRSLCLQAFLSVPPGEWMYGVDVFQRIDHKYPGLNGMADRKRCWRRYNNVFQRLLLRGVLEKLEEQGKPNRYRVAAGARQLATLIAQHKISPSGSQIHIRNYGRPAAPRPASPEPASPEPASLEPALPMQTRSAARAARTKAPVGRQLRGRFLPEQPY